MENKIYEISVRLNLYGDGLDPSHVSSVLGVAPYEGHRKGERRTTAAGNEYATKTGFWSLKSVTKSQSFTDHFQLLLSQLPVTSGELMAIPGVENAIFDVYIGRRAAEEDGGDKCEFDISVENLSELRRLPLPITFTVAIMRNRER